MFLGNWGIKSLFPFLVYSTGYSQNLNLAIQHSQLELIFLMNEKEVWKAEVYSEPW